MANANENIPPGDKVPAVPAPQVGNVALPPAAVAVINGKTERELQLEKELEEATKGRRTAETVASETQDQLTQLKKLQTTGTPPKKKNSGRCTFFHPEEDGED